jgi:hypothetical protein
MKESQIDKMQLIAKHNYCCFDTFIMAVLIEAKRLPNKN